MYEAEEKELWLVCCAKHSVHDLSRALHVIFLGWYIVIVLMQKILMSVHLIWHNDYDYDNFSGRKKKTAVY